MLENQQREENVFYSKRNRTISLRLIRFFPFDFLTLLFFCCISFSIASSFSVFTWNNDTSYPFNVSNAIALTGQDHCIYVFGGAFNDANSVSNSYKFNTTVGSNRAWTPILSMPSLVYFAAGCPSYDNRFFIFGGYETNRSSPNFIQIYDAIGNSWNTTTPNMPSGASIEDYWMSCALDSSTGLMYITGGYFNGTRFYSYNVSSNTITNLSTSSSPTPFNLHSHGSIIADNGNLYVFGGRDGSDYLSSIHIYDTANNSWSTGENMIQATYSFGYVADIHRFYVVGGYYKGENLNYTQVYEISSDSWTLNNGTLYFEGISANTAALLDGSLHSIGGSHNESLFSVHLIATLCGVYAFSGPCDSENQCIINGICESDGTCNGTCISGCNCNSTISTSTSPTTSTSTSPTTSTSTSPTTSTSTSPTTSTSTSPTTSTSTSPTTSTSTSNSSIFSSFSIGSLLGILIAFLFFVTIITVAIVLLLKYKRRQQARRESSTIQLESIPPPSQKRDEENIYTGIETPHYSINSCAMNDPNSLSNNSITLNDNSYVLQMSKLEIIKKIGEGAFGCVYLGILNMTEVAIKKLSKSNISEEDIKEFMAEADLMRNLPAHPNVVMFRGVTLPPDPLSIITDYCNGGSLCEYLKNNLGLPISVKIQFIKDIAKGMLHLHCGIPGKEVIHRDLATRNVLLKNGVAVITDFGLSRVKSSTDDYQKTQQNVGPLKWMSPESLFENKYSTKSDVFSFGVVIYEIITQDPPWKDLNPSQAVGKISHGYRMVFPENCDCPPDLKRLMENCWAQLPEDRPDFKEICKYIETMK